MGSRSEEVFEFVVQWPWESEIPGNRERFYSYDDAKSEGAKLQGAAAGLLRTGSTYPDFRILKRRVETTVVEGTWQVQ